MCTLVRTHFEVLPTRSRLPLFLSVCTGATLGVGLANHSPSLKLDAHSRYRSVHTSAGSRRLGRGGCPAFRKAVLDYQASWNLGAEEEGDELPADTAIADDIDTGELPVITDSCEDARMAIPMPLLRQLRQV